MKEATPTQARALELRRQGLTYLQIALELDISAGSAYTAVQAGEEKERRAKRHGERSA